MIKLTLESTEKHKNILMNKICTQILQNYRVITDTYIYLCLLWLSSLAETENKKSLTNERVQHIKNPWNIS